MVLQFKVPSMVCSGCVETVTKAIKTVDANANVTIDLPSKTVTLESQASEASLKQAIIDTGHTVE
ncbi:MAG: heavy-metal-associated domain-containing protein [Oscillatoriaceae bacterium SKW80]|nr:heavy-metal-associated domain-containing protein [Oscillatoriaceae bacterium SKYG93]MCX8121828.1 heavy-metal-associated domain-containing protein [Oscillatoriaceae bacterium SKW80]MDW8454589.1 heavy-metal-associated domain-containing protein [Oscillatoriaceae cyanobacterium SKYGB_i_bin93]HIK27401.1 heavy-metal-associated domain-containing protein [Oscillatoriaceae cyanobacterium M7585_C2015_266]